jgi:hypothetical protein
MWSFIKLPFQVLQSTGLPESIFCGVLSTSQINFSSYLLPVKLKIAFKPGVWAVLHLLQQRVVSCDMKTNNVFS